MKRLLLVSAVALLTVTAARAQSVTLTMAAAEPGSTTDVSAKDLAEVAAAQNIATIQVQVGQVLTKTLREVAENKMNLTAGPFLLAFMMGHGMGPYTGLGRANGASLASNLRLLYPYRIATFFLFAYQTTGITKWVDLRGKTVFDGPPRGGALILARQMIQATTGMVDGKDYNGKQIDWGQANSIFLDRSVDAAVRPGTNPDANLPILLAAGKINMISVPKAKFENPVWRKLVHSPGRVPIVLPVSAFAHYGKSVRVISEDNKFRTIGEVAGTFVNKDMSKKLAKALTAAFIKSLPDLYKKVPFAKGSLFGKISDSVMGICRAGVKLHPGAVEAWEEAGYKVDACAKP